MMKQLSIFLLLILLNTSAIAQDRVVIHLYSGISAVQGDVDHAIAEFRAIEAEFNALQDDIQLVYYYSDNEAIFGFEASIESLRGPDIVGPLAPPQANYFANTWLDLSPYIASQHFDLSDYAPASIEYNHSALEGQLALPLSVLSSVIMYNKDLFDAAAIPYPPQNYGDTYLDWNGIERVWDIETLREVAMRLTLDATGKNATMAGFDPETIVQFGYSNQWMDLRGRDSLFGAGSFLDTNLNAVIPDNWRAAENWYHQAIWTDYFYPNNENITVLMNQDEWFGPEKVAMVNIDSSSLGWVSQEFDAAWDIAPIPSYHGTTTALIYATSFFIWKGTQHPNEAFTVLNYLLTEKAALLLQLYSPSAFPARNSLQTVHITKLITDYSELYPETDWQGLNWDLALDAIQHAPIPSHESGMPNYSLANSRLMVYQTLVDSNPDADVNVELERLASDLQAIFDAAP